MADGKKTLDRARRDRVEGKSAAKTQTTGDMTGDRMRDAANVIGMQPLLLLAATAIILGNVTACASIAAYQVSHPPYRFPASGAGGGGGNGG
jgi:hypothetical protein